MGVGYKMKLTSQDFAYFKQCCKKYIALFGLTSWRIYYLFAKLEDDFGQCRSSAVGRVATLVLSTNFNTEEKFAKRRQIRSTALHEVLELLMAPLERLAMERTWSVDEYEKEKHQVIRILENTLGNE
jgi:hypothetical protein